MATATSACVCREISGLLHR